MKKELRLQCVSCNGTYVEIVSTIVHFNKIDSFAYCQQCGATTDLPVEGLHISKYEQKRIDYEMPQRALNGR